MKPVEFLDVGATYHELKTAINAAVTGVLEGGWYVLGRQVEAFEQEYAAYCGARWAVGVANGLDALVLGLRALNVGPGDEVIVPANTYIATWLAVSAVGAVPIPVEPQPGTWTMDPAAVAAAITPRTRVILPVHLYGMPCDLEPLLVLAQAHGLRILEDAAQAHGATYRGRRIGAHGDVVAWSFYPGKNLGCFGDGGAVTTDQADLAERIRVLRNYGSRVKYYNLEKGVNSRLDELQAAVLRVKLQHLEAWNARRTALADCYRAALADTPLQLPMVPQDRTSCWHLFVVDTPMRDALAEHLKRDGIHTMIHYPVPPHPSGAYQAECGATRYPITERHAEHCLSLPMGPHLTQDDAARVVASIQRFFA